jgi:hypothetical protein
MSVYSELINDCGLDPFDPKQAWDTEQMDTWYPRIPSSVAISMESAIGSTHTEWTRTHQIQLNMLLQKSLPAGNEPATRYLGLAQDPWVDEARTTQFSPGDAIVARNPDEHTDRIRAKSMLDRVMRQKRHVDLDLTQAVEKHTDR